MASGIYTWIVQRGDKVPLVYVGQSTDTDARRRQYECDFRRETPKENERLGRAVRKYGRKAASFNVVQCAEKGDLTQWEQHYYYHFKEQELLGSCEVANFCIPCENVATQRWGDPEYKASHPNPTAVAVAARMKTYPGFVAPDGTAYRNVHNLRAFCREHELDPSTLSAVVRGKWAHHKGWTVYEGGET